MFKSNLITISACISSGPLAPSPAGAADMPILQPTLMPGEFLPGLALSLVIGLLIGIERGWALRGEPPGARVAGVRTFSMLGLFGGLIGLLTTGSLAGLALVLVAAVALVILVGYWSDMRRTGKVSATSAVAALVTLALGVIASAGHTAIASVGAGGIVILLASRKALHSALRYTSEDDLRALIRLVLVVFVILPLLPDAAMGPYGLNPRRVWFVVVACGGISFFGYVLSRWLGGRRGALITAAVGALVSSTAVTLDSARRVREDGPSPAHDTAIALAQTVMLGRALLLVGLLVPMALGPMAKLLVPGIIGGILITAALFQRSRKTPEHIEPSTMKPPGLALAFLFAAAVAAITVVASWASQRFGMSSGAAVVGLAGLADVDSAIAALAAIPRGTFTPTIAAYAIVAPVLSNSLLKLGIVASVAGVRRAPAAIAALGGTIVIVLTMILVMLA